jgi:hypothetical protein
MSFQMDVTRNRTYYQEFTLYQDDGVTGVELLSTDNVRFKAYRRDAATPDIEVQSATETTNKSSIAIEQTDAPADIRLTLNQADTTSLGPGIYDAELSVVDNVERIKYTEHGLMFLLQAGAGNIGVS